jgi:hypothetical protein
MQPLAVKGTNRRFIRLAQAHRPFDHCVEHRGEVAGRRIDDAEHLGCGGLLFQSFARLGDEPRVFHCDDRLRRETLQQRDLLVGEGPDLLAIDGDRAKECVVFVKRHRDCAADAAGLHHISETRDGPITLIARRIGKMDNPFARYDSSQQGSVTVRPDGTTLPDPIAKLRVAVYGTKMEAFTVPGSENTKGRLAQARCLFQHRLEHRREVAGRAVDDLQYLGGRRLLFQRLARLGNQPRVFHRDHCLRGKVLQQRDLLVGKRPHLLANGDNLTEKNVILAERDKEQGTAAKFDSIPHFFRMIKLRQVGDMDEAGSIQQGRHWVLRAGAEPVSQTVGDRFRQTTHRDGAKLFPVVSVKGAVDKATQRHRLFQHRVEHRREVAGRGVDDLQYLCGRGLLLQRLACLGKEPRILHSDDRLGGEVLQQRDFLLRERPILMKRHHLAQQFGAFSQWYEERGA